MALRLFRLPALAFDGIAHHILDGFDAQWDHWEGLHFVHPKHHFNVMSLAMATRNL